MNGVLPITPSSSQVSSNVVNAARARYRRSRVEA